MNYQDIKTKYFNKNFLILYVIIFIILFIICSFVKFIGQLPILIIITFFIAYYLNNMMGQKINSMIDSTYESPS